MHYNLNFLLTLNPLWSASLVMYYLRNLDRYVLTHCYTHGQTEDVKSIPHRHVTDVGCNPSQLELSIGKISPSFAKVHDINSDRFS